MRERGEREGRGGKGEREGRVKGKEDSHLLRGVEGKRGERKSESLDISIRLWWQQES